MVTKRMINALMLGGLTLMSVTLSAQDNNPANEALENIIIVGNPADVSGLSSCS